MYRISLFLLLFVSYLHIRSQVTIGSSEKPANYSILNITNNGTSKALRLPRYTTAELGVLSTSFSSNSKAEGMLCYDTTLETPVVWDGTSWITVSNFNYNNGLSNDGTKGVLGGDLVRDTDLSTSSYNLSFETGTGTFSVNTDHLQILNNELNVGTATNKVDWTINDGVNYDSTADSLFLASDNSGVTFTTSFPRDLLTVKDDIATIKGEVIHSTPNLSSLDERYPIIANPSNIEGQVVWNNLLSSTTTKTINTKNYTKNYIKPSGTGSNYYPYGSYQWTTISDSFTLDTSGLWMILGRCIFYVAQSTFGTNLNIYLGIFNTTQNKLEYICSALPERKNFSDMVNENTGSYCSPVVNCFLNVSDANVGDEYVLKIMTFKPYVFTSVQTWMGPEYLTAIQINK